LSGIASVGLVVRLDEDDPDDADDVVLLPDCDPDEPVHPAKATARQRRRTAPTNVLAFIPEDEKLPYFTFAFY